MGAQIRCRRPPPVPGRAIRRPVGLRASRADYLSVFLVCFMPAVFAYYPLLLAGTNLAKDGKLPLAVGVWGANVVALIAAFVLARLLVRR